jgi:hypothetical protein
MRKQDHQEAVTTTDLRLWTYAEAVRALPYLRAIARSLREHWLEMLQARQQIRRMDARPGRPNRQTLLLREVASREAELAEEKFEETLRELLVLDVFCRDPVKGLVLVPFHEGDDVAWFVFDLFAPQGQELSRFHADPLEARRSLVEKLDPGLVDELFASRSSDVSMSRPERP